jgi:PIN domain nuclease of toxin-antitoxin system
MNLMNEYVIDTHALYWYLTASPFLSQRAKDALDEGKQGTALIYIPAIVFAELFYMNVKLKNRIDFAVEFQKISQSGQFVFVSFEASDVLDFDKDSAVKEMHDRMIVGAARRLNAPLLTKDANITASGLVKTIR